MRKLLTGAVAISLAAVLVSPADGHRRRRREHQETPEGRDGQRHPPARASLPADRQPERRHPRVRHARLRRLRPTTSPSKLRRAGYSVEIQEFTFPFFQNLAPGQLSQVTPNAVTYETGTFDYSGNGTVKGSLSRSTSWSPPRQPPSSTSGCEAGRLPDGAEPAGHRPDPARHLHLPGEGRERRRRRLRRGHHLQRGQPGRDRSVHRHRSRPADHPGCRSELCRCGCADRNHRRPTRR